MTVVDTSVWIDFFQGAAPAAGLAPLLERNEVMAHPWVVGELALGALGPRRAAILADLGRLPRAPIVGDEEILELIAARSLAGSGIGWVDAQLLGSALVAGVLLWTHDRALAAAALALAVAGSPAR